jgi:hypothetical protein
MRNSINRNHKRLSLLLFVLFNNIIYFILPEDLSRNIIDYRQLQKEQGCDGLSLEINVAICTIENVQGWFSCLPIYISSALRKINPAYTSQNIYRNFGQQAVDQLEKEYRKDHYESSKLIMRIAGVLLLATHSLLSFFDIVVFPMTWENSRNINILIFFVLSLMFSLSLIDNIFKRYYFQVMTISLFSETIGILLKIALSEQSEFGNDAYYSALLIINIYLFLMSGFRFFYSAFIGIVIIFGYVMMEAIINWPLFQAREQFLVVFNNIAFLLNFWTLGIFSSNLLERSKRMSFAIRYAISHSFKKFIVFFECKNSDDFTKTFRLINRSPKILEQFLFLHYSEGNFLGLAQEKLLQGQSDKTTHFVIEESNSIIQKNYFWKRNKKDVTEVLKKIFFRPIKLRISIILGFFGKFKPDYIERFQEEFSIDFVISSVNFTRFALGLGFYHVIVFILVDKIAIPETVQEVFWLRIGIALGAFLTFIFSLNENFWIKYNQLLIGLFLSFSSIIFMVIVSLPKPYELGFSTYYAGSLTFVFYIFLLSRLRFKNSLIVAFLLFVEYEYVAIFCQNLLDTYDGTILWLNNTFFLFISLCVGAVSCNMIERNLEFDFLTRYIIGYKCQELLAFYEHQNPSPRQILDMINGIRYSPQKLKEFLIQIFEGKYEV